MENHLNSPVEQHELDEGHHGDQAEHPLAAAVENSVLVLIDEERLDRLDFWKFSCLVF